MATVTYELESTSKPYESIFSSARRRVVLISLLLVLITLTLYNPAVHYGFVNFDDPGYITTNRNIQSGVNWGSIKWAFRSTSQANWHPLTWLSHALDWQLFHAHAAGHHYTNVLLHTFCVILLFLFLNKATEKIWRSALVALFFAVHPINVESVAWVSERKNILCMVFFFLALLAYRAYVLHPAVKRYLLVTFWFALGLMSKPMVITLPFVLLLLDYWPLGRMNRNGGPSVFGHDAPGQIQRKSTLSLILEKLPLVALSIGSALITMIAQKRGGAVRTQYSLTSRLMNAVVSYARYIGKAFWPSKLSPMYPHSGNTIPSWQVILAATFLIAITVVALKFSQRRYLFMGWLWFLGTLIPVIGLVQVGDQAMADRYAYLPFIGLFIAVVWGVADIVEIKWIPNMFGVLAALLVVVAFSAVSHTQMSYWHDSMALWSHALDVTQHNFVAHDNIGVELLNHRNFQEAEAHFQTAIAINPHDALGLLNLGVCEKAEGNTKGAREHYEAALAYSSDSTLRSVALGNLGTIYRQAGDYTNADAYYTKALQLDPENGFALLGMGLIMQKTGDMPNAIAYYSKAIVVSPSDINYLLLAQAFDKVGQDDQASTAYAAANKMSKNIDLALETTKNMLQ